MRLSDALKEKLMDVRLREKLVTENKLSRQVVDDYLKSLDDSSTQMTYTESQEEKKEEVVLPEESGPANQL